MTELTTFTLPEAVTGSHADHQLGRKLIEAWRTDGIFQVGTHDEQDQKVQRAMAASKAFSSSPDKTSRAGSAN
ncbi:hypothetical protein [Pseudomonas sp. H2_E05]